MKTKFILVLLTAISVVGLYAQQIDLNYTLKLKPVTIDNLPGLHSYAFAQSGNKWLVIGGRKDGIHARQPFNAFPASNNNTEILVIDVLSKQFWTSSVNVLPTGLKEQLQSTNMNFNQDGDTLLLLGGYGFSPTANDHITFPLLTSVSVSGLINAVINNAPILPFFKQIQDQNFAVNGGHLAKISDVYHQIGGHRFDGRYNPMGGQSYTQTYVNGIRKFKINNSSSTLAYSNYSVTTDQVHLHRRDYNLVPQIFPNGDEGYTISSGVFQVGVDLPFLYPVDVKFSGYAPITNFNQYLSNYHSACTGIYDSINNTMHSLFFGGISQYHYVNSVLVQDPNVPFVKTISRVSRDANGNLQEYVLPVEMPALLGASSEFILNKNIQHYSNDVIKLSAFTTDSVLIGHIYGGIYSPQANPFTNNQTSVTSAHPVIYEVWLQRKNTSTGIKAIDGSNPLKINVYPNPAQKELFIVADFPYQATLSVFITDISGKIVKDYYFNDLKSGKQTLMLTNKLNLAVGIYTFNFVFDDKFSFSEKVIINH